MVKEQIFKMVALSVFSSWFSFSNKFRSRDTRQANLDHLKVSSYQMKICGRYSMLVNATYVWNHLQHCHQNVIFHQYRANKLKETLSKYFSLKRYQTFQIYLHIVEPNQDFSPCFGCAVKKLFAVINIVLNNYTFDILLFSNSIKSKTIKY